jgi:predicted DsbA family dithiol-disulfide isomerase
MTRHISVTFDYRCPFARNAHEAVVRAVQQDAGDIDWFFQAFSLDQVHVEEGATPVWERPPAERGSGVLALEYGIAVRDAFPEHFLDAHVALFAARHDKGRKLHEVEVLHDTLATVGLDPDEVAAEVASGRPLAALAQEHQEAVDKYAVFGVPTFVEDGVATFVRFMERDRLDDLERMLDLLSFTRLNELKRTQLPR